ncbi:MAG: hypothetical protein HQK53_11535 [Oligoflexia bacterium]|nr:hypothetical protein [Oligoflexia bacterium]
MKKSIIEIFLQGEDGQLYDEHEKHIYRKYQDCLIIRGKTILVPYARAHEFICDSNNYPMTISGIDVFKINEKGTEPLDIATFSMEKGETWLNYKKINTESAISFLREIPTDNEIFIEFVFMTEEKWQRIHPT